MDLVENAKRVASETGVEEWLKNNQVVGIGSGTTIEYAVLSIVNKVKKMNWSIHCVPTSFQAKELILKHHLPITSLDIHEKLDVAFDGADEIDCDLNLIKGGGGCLLQEKVVASCTSNFIVLVDERKCSKSFGMNWTKGIPIEVIPLAYKPVQTKIVELFGGSVLLRQAVSKMGPVVTDNGNFLLDWKFDLLSKYDWSRVEMQLLKIPGVVETGLFIKMIRKVYVGNLDGTCKTMG